MLERIIKAASNKHDVVFDPFCGCATTLVAADRHNRAWIGIDISDVAVQLVNKRIKADQGMFKDITARVDIPERTDLGKLPKYNSLQIKNSLYGEQGGDCNGCGTHFERQHLEVDHIIALSLVHSGEQITLEIYNSCAAIATVSKATEEWNIYRRSLECNTLIRSVQLQYRIDPSEETTNIKGVQRWQSIQ